jgi:hypothetical protein
MPTQVKFKVMLRSTVSVPVCPGVSCLGVNTRFLLLSDSCGFLGVKGGPLWLEDGSVVYNCCWPSPAQSFSSPSPATFYCLRFETPPTWRTRSPYLYPPGTGWPSYTPRHRVHFSSPPTTPNNDRYYILQAPNTIQQILPKTEMLFR